MIFAGFANRTWTLQAKIQTLYNSILKVNFSFCKLVDKFYVVIILQHHISSTIKDICL
jgi:hypothetical protein